MEQIMNIICHIKLFNDKTTPHSVALKIGHNVSYCKQLPTIHCNVGPT